MTEPSTPQLTGRLNALPRILQAHADDLTATGAEEEVAFVLQLLAFAIRLQRTDRLVAQVRGLQRVWAHDMKRLVGEDALRREGIEP